MEKYKKFLLLTLLITATLALSSCGGSSASQQGESESGGTQDSQDEETTAGDLQATAPDTLVQNGEYSDERFIDMMVPHHQTAVDMGKVAQENAEHPELKQLVDSVVSSQQEEIKELRSIREQEYGSSETPAEMNPVAMANMGMEFMPDQLADQQPFDKAFIDSMIPHHSAAIPMASVAYNRSDNPDIQRIAKEIIDSQSKEVGQMSQWSKDWYPEG